VGSQISTCKEGVTVLKKNSPALVARDLLDKHWILLPPVPVEDLADQLGCKIRLLDAATEKNWSGALVLQPTPYIFLRESDNRVHRRFTIAHELGHLVLNHSTPEGVFRERTYKENPQEIEANAFAAELLMPTWMLMHQIRRVGLHIEDLAVLFDVSLQAMKYRIQYL